MPKRISRGPGRLRGKYRSLADLRTLESLALISIKYGISSDDFFGSFVEAWKRDQSTCRSLSIECRKRTRDNAVFLITNGRKVVAQFPISNRILEEVSPLKEFAYVRASRRIILERAKVKPLQIGDLKSGMNRMRARAQGQ